MRSSAATAEHERACLDHGLAGETVPEQFDDRARPVLNAVASGTQRDTITVSLCPSVADWANPLSDPTGLVTNALARTAGFSAFPE